MAIVTRGSGCRSSVGEGIANELLAKNWVDGSAEFSLERLLLGIGKGVGVGIVAGLLTYNLTQKGSKKSESGKKALNEAEKSEVKPEQVEE
jgi:hypothetical protein